MSIFEKIKKRFEVQLEEGEEVLLDERLGITPSVMVGGLIFAGVLLLYIDILLALVGAIIWFILVPSCAGRVIITNRRIIINSFLIFSSSLENFKKVRKPKLIDLLRPSAKFPFFHHWLIIPISLLFKDLVLVIFAKDCVYLPVRDWDKFADRINKIVYELETYKKEREIKEIAPIIKTPVSFKEVPNFLRNNIISIIALYFFIAHGLLTLIFSVPTNISTVTINDEGKYVQITAKVVDFEDNVAIFGKNSFLLLREGNSYMAAKYAGSLPVELYEVTLSGRLEKDDNKIYLYAHFLNKKPNILFEISLYYLIISVLFLMGAWVRTK